MIHQLVFSLLKDITKLQIAILVCNLVIHSLQEVLHSESSFEPRLEPSDEEPMPGVSCTKLDSEKSDRLVL